MPVRTTRVICEAVEARQHLTAATVMGSSSADVIHMTVSSSTILVDVNGFTQSYPTVVYNSVSIQAGNGADKIYIDSNDGAPVTVNAGGGDDEIHLGALNNTLDDVSSPVTVVSTVSNDSLILHDDAANFADTYTVNSNKVTRGFFGGVTYDGALPTIRLSSGDGADVFNVVNTSGANVILDGQAGADVLNLNANGSGAATVSFDTAQDFANVQSQPGGNLNLLGSASLVLTTNLSNFEGNVTLGTGYIVERNSQPAGGLGYWRQRLLDGTTATTPSLISTYAASSAASDAIGYAYASSLPFTTIGSITLNPTDLLLRYTLKGDANLDKSVNFSDLVVLAQNYNLNTKDWAQGDFDLNRSVNFSDLVSLAQNYNQTAPALVIATKAAGPAKRVAVQVLA